MIRIVPYDEQWPIEFRQLAHKIRDALGLDTCIHHIGSTAINSMPAKDIIDIQVSATRLDGVAIEKIAAAGFEFVSPRFDHMPAGKSVPPGELQKLFFRSTGRPANVHVRQVGNLNHRYALLCRDFLRCDGAASAAYARLKSVAAHHSKGEKKTYQAIKDPVFDMIVSAAETWAHATKWVVPPSD